VRARGHCAVRSWGKRGWRRADADFAGVSLLAMTLSQRSGRAFVILILESGRVSTMVVSLPGDDSAVHGPEVGGGLHRCFAACWVGRVGLVMRARYGE
jgi:hypothetical protein